MSQATLVVNRVTIKPFFNDMFTEFFEIDSDFGENEEYFRKNTLRKGFENEAERVSKKLAKAFTKEWNKIEDKDDETFIALIEKYLEVASNYSVKGNQFILGNTSYTSQYEFTLSLKDNADVEVVVSHLQK
jgi:hypothetical protein